MKHAFGLVLLFAAPAFAADREDFAWQWSLPVTGHEGLVAVEMSADVYARVTRADLGDLVVFNAGHAMVPMAVWQTPPQVERSTPGMRSVPWFRVPGAGVDGDPVALSVERGDDGRLSRVRAQLGAGQRDAGEDILVDVSFLDPPVVALHVGIAAEAVGNLNARVDVEGSEDLSQWRPLAQGLALVDLHAQGARLERRTLSWTGSAPAYLRLRRTDSRAPLPLAAIDAELRGEVRPSMPPLRRHLVSGLAEPGETGKFRFVIEGPYPMVEVNLWMDASNSVADVVLSSRADETGPWRPRARFTAFMLNADGDETPIRNLPAALPTVRDRHWRVQTQPPLVGVPQLEFGYRPDRFLVSTQGPAPFVLAAGSVRVERPEYPLHAVFDGLRASRGEDWLPDLVVPGARAPLAGEAALQPPPAPLPWRRWLLWAVLAGGAAFLLLMVLTLLRQPRD